MKCVSVADNKNINWWKYRKVEFQSVTKFDMIFPYSGDNCSFNLLYFLLEYSSLVCAVQRGFAKYLYIQFMDNV